VSTGTIRALVAGFVTSTIATEEVIKIAIQISTRTYRDREKEKVEDSTGKKRRKSARNIRQT